MKICGPKLSLCGLIVSAWGIIQLVSGLASEKQNKEFAKTFDFSLFSKVLMGVFYYIHSVALIEDLPLEEHYETPDDFYEAAGVAYSQVSVFVCPWGPFFFHKNGGRRSDTMTLIFW